jgi:hypothetical protein
VIDVRETQVVYRCDVCGEAGAETCQFSVAKGDPWRADLCAKHKKQIVTVMEHGSRIPKRTRRPATPMVVKKRK